MAGRRIRDEQDARRCVASAKASCPSGERAGLRWVRRGLPALLRLLLIWGLIATAQAAGQEVLR
jgi:hypothetical protein